MAVKPEEIVRSGLTKLKDIAIPSTSFVEAHYVYHIKVSLVDYSWIVRKRYREFCDLHEKLTSQYPAINANLFPPKRLVGNLNAQHVEKRRKSLELYLRHVLSRLDKIPRVLQVFLEFHFYDIFAVTQTLAEKLFKVGDSLLSNDAAFVLTPLQLYCISQRLKLPMPTCDIEGYFHDVGNLYDIIYCVKYLKIVGDENRDLIGLSHEEISYNLSSFKSLQSLEIVNCNIESLQGTYHLQNSIQSLYVTSSIHLLKDILIDQDVWTPGVDAGTFTYSDGSQTSLYQTCSDMVWKHLTNAVFAFNMIPYVDESVTLLRKLEKLDLSHNKIKDIEHLQDLPHLTDLNLSHNEIETLEDVSTKLGNIQVLNLSSNMLRSVGGLTKVYSLVHLDLSMNNIEDFGNVSAFSKLPCLENLNLIGNPVTKKDMYRARLLTAFEERVSQVCLDKKKTSPAEISEVMQFLSRVDTYEMVSSPNPQRNLTPTKRNTGHKKGNRRLKIKNQDVFENSMEASVSSLPATRERKLTDGELQFKAKVQQIRELGGDEWLGIFNELQNDYKQPQNNLDSPCKQPKSVVTNVSGGQYGTIQYDSDQVASRERVDDTESFGFSAELQATIKEKMKEEKLISGTYFTHVQYDVESDKDGEVQKIEEERMIGIDLARGIVLEIEIDSGRTCAKHKLSNVSSVDIVETGNSVYLEMRFEKRRDTVNTVANHSPSLARYKMRCTQDAAELFVLVFKVINDRKRSRSRTKSSEKSRSDDPGDIDSTTNPAGIPGDMLERWLSSKFLHERSSQNELTESERDATQASQELLRLTLWTTCLPYALPEHELPVCLVLTDRTLYLFQVVGSGGKIPPASSFDDLEARLTLLSCLPLAHLRVLVCGMFDLGFRVEFSNRGSRGTFTFLTRDPRETDAFVTALREVTNTSGDCDFQIVHPSEGKLERMKSELAKSCGQKFHADERLLMYAIVREVPDMTSLRATTYTRTLVVTNCRLFLCEEDHVHWPLPSYVNNTPSTPQWAVTKHDSVKRIVGIELFDVVGEHAFIGPCGLSIILEKERDDTKMWHVLFKCADERQQLQRSLSQIWSYNFHGSLQTTAVTVVQANRLQHSARTDVPAGFFRQVVTPATFSPPGSPAKIPPGKGHRRNASGQYTSKQHDDVVGESLQLVKKSDADTLDSFFAGSLRTATAGPDSEAVVCHAWTGCVPYTHPTRELFVWLILSNLKVYIVGEVSDRDVIDAAFDATFPPNTALCCNWFAMTSLRQVCVGFFDQTVRLETDDPETTFTFVTRDYQATANILDSLKSILQDVEPAMELAATCRPNSSPESDYPSIYDEDTNISDGEVSEYLSSPQGMVKFVYPSDDSVDLLRHTIIEFSRTAECLADISEATILLYLLVFEINDGKKVSRTFIILDDAVCLCVEDHVNFPLPLFVKGLPMGSRYEISRLRPLATIKRIEFSGFNTHDFTIVFDNTAPNCETHEDVAGDATRAPQGHVRWTLIAQTYEEREKALTTLLQFCAEKFAVELPVLKI